MSGQAGGMGETDLGAILARLSLQRRPDAVAMVGLGRDVTAPPLGDGVLAVIQESEGPTVVATVSRAEREGWQHDFVAAWLTVQVHSSLEAIGLTAAMARVLTEQEIPCNVVAGFYHDHLLIPLDRTDDAIDALMSLVEPVADKPASP